MGSDVGARCTCPVEMGVVRNVGAGLSPCRRERVPYVCTGRVPSLPGGVGGLFVAAPDHLAEGSCKELAIPVTTMGSGRNTNGQKLNMYDILGLVDRFSPRFVKKYADLSEVISQALQQYKLEVEQGVYPGPEHI